MKAGDTRWGYSVARDSEWWQGADSRDVAVNNARDAARADGASEAWVQAGVAADPFRHVPSFDRFVEDMEQNACDNDGPPDFVDEAFHFEPGAEEAFTKMMQEWCAKYVRPNWWTPVGKPERVDAREGES